MNVELIKIDPAVATAKLASYRKVIAARHHSKATAKATAEYEQIVVGYEAAAKGLALIELSKAMAMGGWDEMGRPRFAVAWAHRRQIWGRGSGDDMIFSDLHSRSAQSEGITRFRFTVPGRPIGAWRIGRAIVPMVPPDVLPRANCDLSKRVILWEADWQVVPADPLLLLPLGGDLYAVEAAWDLTPLERAVIAGRTT